MLESYLKVKLLNLIAYKRIRNIKKSDHFYFCS